jgi:hypothetical protein
VIEEEVDDAALPVEISAVTAMPGLKSDVALVHA